MSLLTRKIAAFAKKVANLSPKPGGTMPVAELQAQFDAAPEELRAAFNGAMDDLISVTPGSSGAENIGSAPITGVSGATPYAQMTDLKAQITTTVLGQIPDGTLTKQKQTPDLQTASNGGQIYAYRNFGGL